MLWRWLISILILLLPVLGSTNPESVTNQVEALISSMSLEKKIGQMFIFGFTGTDYEHSLKKKINTLYPGSIIVFGRNIKTLNQIRALNHRAQAEAIKNTQLPLFIAVDQEGGKVLRIRTSPSLPSARTLALTEDPALVRSAGYVTGQLLSVLGFNMNLAPVVDISDPQQRDFLGNRTFSYQKEIVRDMSVAFARGLLDSNVMPTAKHFPGHGGMQTDSHLTVPYKQITLAELLSNDLSPYRGLLEERVPFAIMASHVAYPLIDDSRLPATFSKILLQDVLRQKLGYEGIVLTDDIQMEGARLGHIGVGEKAIRAILAGTDVIMVGWNYQVQKQAVDAVYAAVKSGRIPEWRVEQSLRRIFRAKLRFFKDNYYENNLNLQLNQIAFTEIYDSIFTKVLDNQRPVDFDLTKPIDVYSYSHGFLQSFKDTYKNSARYFHLSHFRSWKSSKGRTVVFHLSGPVTANILRTAPASLKKSIVVVNSSSGPILRNEQEFKKVMNVYSYHPNLGSFTAKNLAQPDETYPAGTPEGGKYPENARLPVDKSLAF